MADQAVAALTGGMPPCKLEPGAVIVATAHAALRQAGFAPNVPSTTASDAAAATAAGVGMGACRYPGVASHSAVSSLGTREPGMC